MRKKIVAWMLTAAVLGAAAGCGNVDDSSVAATINGEEVPFGVANFFARYNQAEQETYYAGFMGENMWEQQLSEGETYEETVKAEVLDLLETMYVLEDHTKDYGVEISEDEKKKITKAAQEFDEANGLDEKKVISGDTKNVERVLTLMLTQSKMREAMTADVDTEVSDEEAAQKKMAYLSFPLTETKDDGSVKELSEKEKKEVKKKAEKFQKGAKSAADFEAYAKEQGQEAKTMTFDAETKTPDEGLMTVVNTLKEGETTEVIETDNGYYVARVTSLLDKEATDAKKAGIVEKRKKEKYEELCKEWKDASEIKTDKKVWQSISFQDQGVTIKQEEEIPYADKTSTDTETDEEADTDTDTDDEEKEQE